jgi:hypothetical protein
VKRTPDEIAKHVKDMQARYAQAQLRIEAKKRREEECDDHCTFRPALSAQTGKVLEERRRRIETEGERPKRQPEEEATAKSMSKAAPLDAAARKARAEAFRQRNEKLLASRATWEREQREQRLQDDLGECTFQPRVSCSMPRDIYERLEQRRALHGGVFERLSSLSGGGRSDMGPTYDPATGLYFDPVTGQTFTPEEYAHAGEASYRTAAEDASHHDRSIEGGSGGYSVGVASPAPVAPSSANELHTDPVVVAAPLVTPVQGSISAGNAADDKARDLQATLAEWRTLAGL